MASSSRKVIYAALFGKVNLSVDFDSCVGADEVEAAVKDLDARIKHSLPRVKRIFIEAEGRRTSAPSVED